MDNNIKVSVVIPVYNVEEYLEQCLDSIVDQTLGEIEIICVQNGSTDDSVKILKRYKEDDRRIRVINVSEAIGPGAARNKGMEAAKGKYIAFVDSDDYLKSDALSILYKQAEELEADVVISDIQDVDAETGRKIGHSYIRKSLSDNAVFNINDDKNLIYNFTSALIHNKFCRLDFLRKNDIHFQNIICMEDSSFSMLILSCAEKITIVDKKLYFYRRNRAGSIFSEYNKHINSLFESFEYAYDELEKRSLFEDPDIRQAFIQKAYYSYVYSIRNIDSFEEYTAFYNRIKEDNGRFSLEDLDLDRIPSEKIRKSVSEMKELDASGFIFEKYIESIAAIEKHKQEIENLDDKLEAALKAKNSTFELERKEEELIKIKAQLRKAEIRTSELMRAYKSMEQELKDCKAEAAKAEAAKSEALKKGTKLGKAISAAKQKRNAEKNPSILNK